MSVSKIQASRRSSRDDDDDRSKLKPSHQDSDTGNEKSSLSNTSLETSKQPLPPIRRSSNPGTKSQSSIIMRDHSADKTKRFKGNVMVGLKTSESPDSVGAWCGRPKEQPYGKPFLACDPTTRLLALPQPLCTLWHGWMRMTPTAGCPSQTVSEEDVSKQENGEGSGEMAS